MKTSLHFEGPSDLSVGTVRITSRGRPIVDWVATPGNRSFYGEDVEPGLYNVEISPAGVSPRSVLFEVAAGRANRVSLPSFAALASSGSNTTVLDAGSPFVPSEPPRSALPESGSDESFVALALPSVRFKGAVALTEVHEIDRPVETRLISIGLSAFRNWKASIGRFHGRWSMTVMPSRLEIVLPNDAVDNPWAGSQVRLSAAIEKVRIERCFLPLYTGGTRIVVEVSPYAASDVELDIMPIDPRLRALTRALHAGTNAELAAVGGDLGAANEPDTLLAEGADPWAAILAGLLAIRSPDAFRNFDRTWADRLVARAGWAYDSHVVRAGLTLAAAKDGSREEQDEAVGEAVASLVSARSKHAPYYRYTEEVFGALVSGIAYYFAEAHERIGPAVQKAFAGLRDAWNRDRPLRRGAGLTFTWLARDEEKLKEGVLAPNRRPSGRLRSEHTSIILRGEVGAGRIAVFGSEPNAASPSSMAGADLTSINERSEDRPEFAASRMPALSRDPGPEDDPNKGRFGGRDSRDGFRLTARFEPAKSSEWVSIVLRIEADQPGRIGLGDFAWFVLHPTFTPREMKVAFRGRRAELRVLAWGGFTVGAWLPRAGVELECDLSEAPGAPKVVRTR